MATSLAQQLQGIRQSASNASFQKRKRVASFLFDASEAADQDYDQVFAVAINGFEELTTYNAKLAVFSRTIFSDDSRTIDRNTQTREQNDALDGKLEAFLRTAAPQFLLRPMHKCLEWLIRRFDVQVHLAEKLLLIFMPFHGTPAFSKLLAIIELPLPWSFLGAVKKSGDSPSVFLFIKSFVKAPATLSAFLDHVQSMAQAGQGFHALISLYADISVHTISMMRDNKVSEEAIISRFLPYVAEALTMKEHTEYQVANYMVLTVLSATRSLSRSANSAILQALMLGLTTTSQKSGLICLAQLCQAQDGYEALSPQVYQTINRLEGCLDQILALAEKYRADKLLTAFSLSAAQDGTPESLEVIQKILTTGRASISPILDAVAQRVLASADLPDFRVASASFLEDLQRRPKFGKSLAAFYDRLGPKADDLELALQISLDVPAAIDVPPKMRRQSSSRPAVNLEDDIAELPKLAHEQTYLSTSDVRRTINVLQAATAVNRFSEVLESPVVNETVNLKLSFLVRAALSSNDVETQVKAIDTLSKTCKNSEDTDYQALIPVVISLLSSKSQDVRRQTLEFATLLLQQAEVKSKKTIWGLEDVYGSANSRSLKWLSSQETYYFLESIIVANRHECLLDHKVIYRAVAQSVTTHGTKGKELSHKTAALHFLASHIISSPIVKISLKLLLCFDKVREPTAAKTRAVLPLLEKWISNPEPLQSQSRVELIDPIVVERLLVRQVVPAEHGPATAILIKLVHDQNDEFGPLAIEWLANIFADLKKDTKVEFIRALIEAIIDGPSQVSRQAHTSVDSIDVSTETFAQMINEINLSPQSSRMSTPIKKQKKDIAPVSPDVGLRRFTHLLEILERDDTNHAALLPALFSKLGDLVLIETESSVSVSYTQQILLSCMYPMVDPGKFDSSTCRIDILINCIRVSSSPQVHNRALLLVAAMAEAAPEQVLHGVMPIFTFMGANILRQDDGFSAHVIESTIQRVVPPLLKSLGQETQSQILGAAGILRSFVDAFPHIPKHRRSKLFLVLIQTMGETVFLAPLLAIFTEKRVEISPKAKSGESQKSYLEFCLALLRQFNVSVQLQALFSLVEIARSIPETVEDLGDKVTLLTLNHASDAHLEKLKASVISIIGGHFASRKVRAEFEIYASDDDWTDKGIFINIVESLLRACEDFDANPEPLDKSLDALDRAITLLPVALFRAVVHDLLDNKQDEYMRVKALDIVSGRVSSVNPNDESARLSFLGLVEQISGLLLEKVSVSLLCASLQGISTIGRKFGKADPSTFAAVVETVIGENGLGHTELIVRVSAIECLTTLTVVLGPRILPHLQKFMHIVLEGYAKVSKDQDADLVPLATISLLEALIKTIPAFMTPYTQTILERSADFSYATEELTSDKRSLLSTIAQNMPTRNVLEALGGAWEKCSRSGKKPLMALIVVIEETIETSERKVVTGAAKEILALFLQALDIRRKSKAWDAKGIEQVEKRVIAAFLKVVLKLNDSTFRPMFVSFRNWALSEFMEKDAASLQCRRITFFNFLSQFTGTFKSIVLNYFNYVIEDILEILQVAGDLTVVPRRLWIGVISSLEHGFASDNEDFWRTPDKFDRIAPVLIGHLDYAETYPVLTNLIPAIVELTASSPSEDHFKLINTQVLQKFRAEVPAVRLAAVTAANKLSAKMGDEWLSMLPQTIPFIAEALEDEDERVEKQTHSLAMTIESFLGESLDSYLR